MPDVLFLFITLQNSKTARGVESGTSALRRYNQLVVTQATPRLCIIPGQLGVVGEGESLVKGSRR